jgi:hypothetical protein
MKLTPGVDFINICAQLFRATRWEAFNGKWCLANGAHVSISSTFYIQIFCTNIVLTAFTSYVLALSKNLYQKHTRMTLMKLTTDWANGVQNSACKWGFQYCIIFGVIEWHFFDKSHAPATFCWRTKFGEIDPWSILASVRNFLLICLFELPGIATDSHTKYYF